MSNRRNFVDESWAIWIDGDDTTTIYFNEWISPKKNSYVDVAIRVINIMQSNKLKLYIPFKINIDEIEDLSPKLKDEKIIRAIFSSTCIIDFMKNEHTSEIAYNGKTIDLVHLNNELIELEDKAKGTILTYDLSALHSYLDNDECYFIFRIPHKSLNQMFKKKVSVHSFFERIRDSITTPVIKERFGFSIRINEGRLIPQEINKIGAFHRQKLQKAVVTISIDEDYELNDENCFEVRRLEKDLYETYVPEKFRCEDAVTYLWQDTRKKNLKGSFNFFLNISREFISKTSLLIYMLLILFVGVIGERLWEIIIHIINNIRLG